MTADSKSAGPQGERPHKKGRAAKTPARRAWSAVFSILLAVLATLGGLVLIGVAVFVAEIGIFGRIVADHILANAIRPSGREMPVTVGALPYASADIQIIGGMGQGLSCSLPWIMDELAFPTGGGKSPIGLKMRQACAYHDYCYRHGAATYGYTQADCDFALQVQAFRLCAFIEAIRADESGRQKEGDCMRDARLVTLGVRIGGSDAFRTLGERDVPSIEGGESKDAVKNRSTYFEFDPYPTKAMEYFVYRIADAPQSADALPGAKAIYRFRIRPSGTSIYYSLGFQKFAFYAEVPGNPHYLTSPPLVVRAGAPDTAADWLVWWQRAGEDQTTGRLIGMAPRLLRIEKERSCLGLPAGCATSAIVAVQIGNDESLAEDPQIDQLLPADLGQAGNRGISMVTLRHHRCLGRGNAPCYVHVLVKTDAVAASETAVKMQKQPQEPLSINDRLSPKPASVDRERYRNFAALPYVLFPPGADDPVIAWTRRDTNYQTVVLDYRKDALLRRAAVDPGEDKERRDDDAARSQGTVLLQGFAEAHEPAFILGRSTDSPILASLTDDTAVGGASTSAVWTWPLPPPDMDDKALEMPTVRVDPARCRPGLEAEWLHRPPQILGRPDGSALAVFSQLRPHVSKDWIAARLQLATLKFERDGTCPGSVQRGPEIHLETSKPSETDQMKDPVERGRREFVRMSRKPILLADLNGDGSTDVTLAEGPETGLPRLLCSIAADGACIAPSNPNGE